MSLGVVSTGIMDIYLHLKVVLMKVTPGMFEDTYSFFVCLILGYLQQLKSHV